MDTIKIHTTTALNSTKKSKHKITTIKNRCDRRVGQKTVIADTLGESCQLAKEHEQQANKATDNIFIADNLMQRLPQGRQDSRHLVQGVPKGLMISMVRNKGLTTL